jgi:hypothetical protein
LAIRLHSPSQNGQIKQTVKKVRSICLLRTFCIRSGCFRLTGSARYRLMVMERISVSRSKLIFMVAST